MWRRRDPMHNSVEYYKTICKNYFRKYSENDQKVTRSAEMQSGRKELWIKRDFTI